MIELVDTHAHIHFDDYGLDPDEVLADARKIGVNKVIVVGCDLATSKKGLEFAVNRKGVWSAIGVHPHEAKDFLDQENAKQEFSDLLSQFSDMNSRAESSSAIRRPADAPNSYPKTVPEHKLVAIGECGLDYYYEHSPKSQQIELLEFQLDLAQKHNLPVIFHVREAHSDFWPIYDNFPGIKGVMHSFSAGTKELNEALKRDLYIGLNGIMTFTKDEKQLESAKAVPDDKMILETDAPYLTPSPQRGKVCKPEHVRLTAEFLAALREQRVDELARYTSRNASQLFNLKEEIINSDRL